MLFRQLNDPELAQYAYLVGCQRTGEALLIDPERDIDRYVRIAEAEGLEITAVAETHIHADFLSGAREFAVRYGTRIYLSDEGGDDWRYGWPDEEGRSGGNGAEVTLLRDGDSFRVGSIEVRALHTPGHTPEHLSYLVIDRGGGATAPLGVATGDFVFVGDVGRPDLLEQAAGLRGVQEDSARELFRSLPRFTELEGHVQVWPGHGAGSVCGKAPGAVPTTTVGYEKRHNEALAAAEEGEDAFVTTILADQPEPPMYFSRMKRQNRDGPPLLGDLPRPRRLTAGELERTLEADEATVVDTRIDRAGFMARHLPGSLYAPLNRTFPTAVGSLVVDETRPILLVVDGDRVEEAVRGLVRIGYDHLAGYVDLDTLQRFWSRGGARASIEALDFDDVADLRRTDGVAVLDVRYASEFDEGHVPGAVQVPYTRLPERYERDVPATGTLLVHCSTGARSAAAGAWLAARGRDVRYVYDRWSAWAEGGRPVERNEPDRERAGAA